MALAAAGHRRSILATFEAPRKRTHVLIEGLESDLGASLVEALWILDRRRGRRATLVRSHLRAEDLLAPFVDSHAVGQVGELARRCLAAGNRL